MGMAYIVEVDQSIKIEQSGATVLAFSDGISHAILIPSLVKTEVLRVLVSAGKSKATAHLLLFAACLYLLLEGYLDQLGCVVIDTEYSGKEAEIKAVLLRYVWRKAPTFAPESIMFKQVGKGSPADKRARDVRLGRDNRYRRVTLAEVLRIVLK
jgi:hypothetical protein